MITTTFNEQEIQNIIRLQTLGRTRALVAALLGWEHDVLDSQSGGKGDKAPLESFQQHIRESHGAGEAARVSPRLVAAESRVAATRRER